MQKDCNWKNVKSFNKFICLARTYPNKIVSIDFYDGEDDCRQYRHDFCKYTKIFRYYHIQYQATYEIILSSKHMENILVKHDVHLILCLTSDYYAIAHSQLDIILSTNREKRKHQSTSSLANSNNEKDSNDTLSFSLISYLQSNVINYSIASSAPIRYKQNLSFIYQHLDKNKNNFTCEHIKWLNENALKSSFASQQLKTELINYVRKNYTNCYEQTILLQQFRQTTDKWQQEMNDTIDRNARIAIDLAIKIHKQKLIKRQMCQQEIQTKLFEEDNDDSQQE
ncbi:unnamed protein product [Rotaria socialis]|uniref:Uncharacterized protein n=2 Tax=Rotaria socialis TaxID=392032 RepID=A0A820TBC6_9BILA|nr:unnamed protein product [Rotaria socialis]CAF3696002.1 unnamed protein product [Rotaria socialis]CAF4467030.1 unnamed protein product [Rotaria socialis]CAF4468411.1 unnamed protein product [Rotaria socialis]CAF4469857.1 unnamed protein product [Rotaria socialis]